MQIDIDFEVYKALTALRQTESDSHNAVIRRLLKLSEFESLSADANDHVFGAGNYIGNVARGRPDAKNGAWIGNVFFPNGTKFRATYKGQTFLADIANERWVDEDGTMRQSPSEAAKAISKTNVNGWRFWHAQLPGDPSWRRLDELKK